MPVQPIPQEQQDQWTRELRGRWANESPPIANVEAAVTAHDEGRLRYRGRWYRVPYVRWRARLEITALNEEYQRLMTLLEVEPDPVTVRKMAALVDEMLAIFGTMIEWKWWQVRNPLRDPEEGEFQAITHFFSTARTRCPVVALASVRARPWYRTTWPMRSPPLRVGIRAGWERTATPAAGATLKLV